MKTIRMKLLALILTASLVLVGSGSSLTAIYADDTDDSDGVVYISIDAKTLGLGYIVYPVAIEISEGDTVYTVFEKLVEETGLSCTISDTGYGAYLSGINDVVTKEVSVPEEISALPSFESWGYEYVAPTTDSLYENTDNNLDEYDYTYTSGWMFLVNNEGADNGMSYTTVSDGDVIRFRFTIYGYGIDIGTDQSSWTGIEKVELVDEDEASIVYTELTELLSDDTLTSDQEKMLDSAKSTLEQVMGDYYTISQEYMDFVVDYVEYIMDYVESGAETLYADKTALEAEIEAVESDADMLNDSVIAAALANAIAVVDDDTASQELVDAALAVLQQAEADYSASSAGSASSTEETTVPALSKGKIKKIKALKKYKAKVTIKKQSAATGYQIKYSSSKSMKSAKTKSSTKRIITTKALTGQKKIYVRARAYVTVNGTKYYGKWSKKVSKKLKKK